MNLLIQDTYEVKFVTSRVSYKLLLNLLNLLGEDFLGQRQIGLTGGLGVVLGGNTGGITVR